AAPLAHAASVKQEIPAQWDMEADVVVLGAGGAGLMAACQAHDRGAKVVVFNKGGSSYHTGTNLCGGLFTACGSRMQKADPKIKDDWKAFADDIIAYGE
ncbi:MAG TPA: FAD-binding protein, partial [Sutterella wadsworthensis]|nr:FAD-binding protein [Sutterella wadsworthensis]